MESLKHYRSTLEKKVHYLGIKTGMAFAIPVGKAWIGSVDDDQHGTHSQSRAICRAFIHKLDDDRTCDPRHG